ncbi:dihydroxyacetone kinase subunit DhaK (plasmid) [Mesorhizobium sp. B2-1-8]|uniref:dihydroxyacetone kinase subunit DhaK n=1 Tax=Mesorhizobium sp. B2-1-8 TaxID=2589967 RepID=UPI00112CB82F|nr:dihydroxyacetone kinase subunit DhaK [Mesorhizobium sp. B2-1-8]UCI22811.1 dihydroxyacetone kinase subunit DhaK [Mesorhizobium sp. B2-1-8]
MKKLINRTSDYVDEMLQGLVLAHPSMSLDGEARRVVRRTQSARPGKVGIVSGGGSGHLPLFTGYVGEGLLDACSIGNVFEGPNVASCIEAIRTASGGVGVLLLYGNYGGDRMNFDMASEVLDLDGIETRTVLGTDDIASAPSEEAHKRRGVAGIVYAYKVAGAYAEEGADLGEVVRVAQKSVEATRTIGIALSGCQVPGAETPSFAIGDGEMEMGIGIHGEPGIWRDALRPADIVASEMIDRLLAEKPTDAGNRVSILVNSLGATPLEELFILYRKAASLLEERKLEIVQPLVGPYATSMEMAGASISLCFLDDELERLLAAPAECPFWRVGK